MTTTMCRLTWWDQQGGETVEFYPDTLSMLARINPLLVSRTMSGFVWHHA